MRNTPRSEHPPLETLSLSLKRSCGNTVANKALAAAAAQQDDASLACPQNRPGRHAECSSLLRVMSSGDISPDIRKACEAESLPMLEDALARAALNVPLPSHSMLRCFCFLQIWCHGLCMYLNCHLSAQKWYVDGSRMLRALWLASGTRGPWGMGSRGRHTAAPPRCFGFAARAGGP